MNFLRKVAVSISAGVLSLLLLATAWTSVLTSTLRNRDTLKGWFTKSGFYDQIVDVALEKINFHQENSSDQVPINDDQIKDSVRAVLTPAFLQQSIEDLLDGTYNWLDGSSNTINFDIDLNGVKQSLADNLGEYMKNRVDSLPECDQGKSIEDFNGFTGDCKPAGISGAELASNFSEQLLNGDFLKDTSLTGGDIKLKQADGTSVALDKSSQGEAVKKAYRYSGYAPILMGLLTIVAVLGVIFFSKDHLKGIRRAGVTVLTVGVLLLITAASISFGLNKLKQALSKQQDFTASQVELATNFANEVFNSLNSTLGIFTGIYIVSGAGAIVGSHYLRKKRSPKEEPKAGNAESAEKQDNDTAKDTVDKSSMPKEADDK